MQQINERLRRRRPGVEETAGLRRFGARSLLGVTALLAGALPFLVLLLVVRAHWSPASVADREIAADLNASVSEAPRLVAVLRTVTSLGDTATAVLVFALTTVFLLIRGQRRLASFVVVTGAGLAALVPVAKAWVDRARPVVDVPLAELPSNASFPSGHAATAVVTYGMVALLVAPVVRRRLRPWLAGAAVVVAVAVGLTRIALGVHFLTDVLAGWSLGAGLLAVTAATFRSWQHDHHRPPAADADALDMTDRQLSRLAASGQSVLADGLRTAVPLAGWGAGLAAVLVAAGLLVTGVLGDSALGRFDRAAVRGLLEWRSDVATDVLVTVSALSGTRMVIAGTLTLCVVALAVTASWRPVGFVIVTVLGELGIYYLVSRTVGRLRPEVADLTSGLPTGASWPSGHTAAAVALYGALAALVLTLGRGPWTRIVVAAPLLIAPAVGFSRVYLAAHYPTDVLAGLVLGAVWVTVSARYLLPGVTPRRRLRRRTRLRRRVQPSPATSVPLGQG